MATAELDGDRIVVTTQWNEKDLIKSIAGARWDTNRKVWTLPLTWAACIQLRGVFGATLGIGDGLAAWAWSKRKEVDQLIEMRSQVAPPVTLRTSKLYPFQQVGANFIWLAGEALLGDEMGTGKTIQALSALDAQDGYPVLVICPNSVKTHWATETNVWQTWGTPYVVTGGAVSRKKILEAASNDPRAIVIVNYEALRGMTRLAPYGSVRLRRCRTCDKKNGEEGIRESQCQVHPRLLNRILFRTVVVDEAHRIKDPKSQQTRAVWAVAHQDTVQYRWALTGTPLANHPGDLWSILHCISPKDFPTKSHFVDRYCLQSWNAYGGLDIVGVNPATRDEFFKLLDPRFRRMPKELVLSQLPPKVRSTRWVELTPAQRKQYDNIDKHGATILDGGDVLVPGDPLIDSLRMMQFASATIKLEDGRYRLAEPSAKLDAMEEILDELGPKQVVICAESKQLIDLAAKRIGDRRMSYGLITGGISEYERNFNLKQFQDGSLQVLLFTVKAGGVGLTMTAADTMIRLQRSWSMIDNKQAEDRIHRIGAEVHESIHIIDIVAVDTIEEEQMGSLAEKFMRLQEIARDRATMLAAGQNTYELDTEEDAILRSELL